MAATIRLVAATVFLLPLSLFAQPAPQLTFVANAIVARVTPGAATAWVSTNRVSGSNSLRSHFVRDDDGDGVVRWETGPISARSGWAVVDLTSGGYTVVGAGNAALPEKALPNAAILRGRAGTYSEFVVPGTAQVFRYYLVARAGIGAWVLPMADLAYPLQNDLDRTINGITVFRASQFVPLGDAPSLSAVRVGDLLIAIEAGDLAYIARKIDAAYLATGDGPGVLHTPVYGFGTDKDGSRVPVIRVGGSDGTVSLDYQTVDKTAKNGVHYTAVSGALTFLPGDVLQFVEIPTIPDGVHTGIETQLELQLANPVGTTVVGPMTFPVRIVDGERPPSVVIESKNVPEGDGGRKEATLKVTLVGPTAKTAVVPWYSSSTANVAAETQGTLRFEPGETTKFITVAWDADDVRKGNGVIVVVLAIYQAENVLRVDNNANPIFDLDGVLRILEDDGASKQRSVRR